MTAAEHAQDRVFALLADPATHRGATPTRIDTHAAAVFLAGDDAYKIKKAVRFPFLDFSTLEKRKAALESEIDANKPFASELYLGLIPVTATNGKLVLGGAEEPIEWVLHMRRFDETKTLDRVPPATIDENLARTLSTAVAQAHARAPVVAAGPWITALSDYIAQNAEAFAQYSELFPPHEARSLSAATDAALRRIRPLLEARGTAGLIRRGHGDLHLGNIALIDGRPVPFDALEFDPVVASGDVLYDLAFLLMDLVHRGLDLAANVVLNGYFAATRREQDLDALAALPLFLSLRAAIRAKVTAAKIGSAEPELRPAIGEDAKSYFALACRLMAPPAPQLVAVGGLSGTGKSVLARALAAHIAPAPGALIVRSDIERKLLFGIGELDRLPEQAYAAEFTQRVYATLADKARRVLAAGHSAIVDAVFARPGERAMIDAVAKASGVAFRGVFLTADLATRVARVGARIKDASDADAAVARMQEGYDLTGIGWTTLDASGTPAATLALALDELKRNG
jgi:aminoglycoside phosphotransferase family enzyme/predicted kinase